MTSTCNKKLIVEHDDNGVVRLILNRPEVKNALDEELISLLGNTLEALESKHVQVLQLRGTGDYFSAGADLSWMQKAQSLDEKDNYYDALKLAKFLHKLSAFPASVVAVINGPAYGGALGMIAASDIVVASESSKFCFSEVKLGLIPAVISPYVIAAIGARQAQRYFLTAETFNSDQAKALGLIHDIFSDDKLEDAVTDITQKLLKSGPQALIEVKKLIQEVHHRELSDHLVEFTAQKIAAIRVSDEAKEGLNAFFNKRKPEWRVS